MTHSAPFPPGLLDGDQKIVVLAPHPDDETLGCGGLLARAFAGAGAHVICLTDGSASHPGSQLWPPARLAETRRAELGEALIRLGGTADDMTWLGFPDSRLHEVDPEAILAPIEEAIASKGAQHIFVPAIEDKHCDHKTTARLAATLRERHPEWQFYSYPVWSRWDDLSFDQAAARNAPVFLDTRAARPRKRAAIAAHRSQLGQIVPDAPDGFVLPDGFVEKFVGEREIFWRMP